MRKFQKAIFSIYTEFYYDIANNSFNLKRIKEYADYTKLSKNTSKKSFIDVDLKV